MSAISVITQFLASLMVFIATLTSGASSINAFNIHAHLNDVTETENLVNSHKTEWDTYDVIAPDQIRLYFSGPSCQWFNTKVTDQGKNVKVELFSGIPEDLVGKNRICSSDIKSYTLVVQLPQPLGLRKVVQ